jgi:hypothetical protein
MTTTIRQFAKLQSLKNSLKVVAAGSLAVVGATAIIPAGAAQAISFNTGELDFGVFTSPFAANVAPIAGNFFDVTFDPGGAASIFTATGSFSPTFTSGTTIGSNSPTVRFTNTGGNNYTLNQDLVLNFSAATPTSFTLRQNSTFIETEIFNGSNIRIGSGLQLAIDAGSFFTNGGINTTIPTLSFSFNDTGVPTGGLFIAQATPTSVPEPFSVIGTIVGGTAAFRMRKKLAKIGRN